MRLEVGRRFFGVGGRKVQIAVLIEPVAGNGYRARGIEVSGFSAEGPTQEAALDNLKRLLQSQLTAGCQIVSLEVPAAEHPLAKVAGIFDPNDPDVQEWKRIMAENRRQADQGEG
jgi:hypothetical protein